MKLLNELLKKSTPVFVEIRGRDLVFAEGYCRIEHYSEEKIVLASNLYKIAVFGCDLKLRHLTDERIAIEGRIDGVEFI